MFCDCNCEALLNLGPYVEFYERNKGSLSWKFRLKRILSFKKDFPCYENGRFSAISWFGRFWRILTGRGVAECEITYVGVKLMQHCASREDSHKRDLPKLNKTLERFGSVSEFSMYAADDPISGGLTCDKWLKINCSRDFLIRKDKEEGRENSYNRILTELKLCGVEQDACRVFKTVHLGKDLLGFSNGCFYRVAWLEKVWRCLSFKGFQDCESDFVTTHIVEHFKNAGFHDLKLAQGLIKGIGERVKDKNKKMRILKKVNSLPHSSLDFKP